MPFFVADLILAAHAIFVAYVTLGLVVILLGGYLRWRWVKNIWFRVSHLVAIGFVVAESWLGLICPLTKWENSARVAAGGEAYSVSFIQHWLHAILFYDFEPWVFKVAYSVFGITVLAAWVLVPPEHRWNKK